MKFFSLENSNKNFQTFFVQKSFYEGRDGVTCEIFQTFLNEIFQTFLNEIFLKKFHSPLINKNLHSSDLDLKCRVFDRVS